MRLIRVFPRRTSLTPTDPLAFVGGPPLAGLLPDADEVHVSVTFTWDIQEGYRLQREWDLFYPTKIGGPALGTPLGAFVPGRYLAEGVTFTTRGCNHKCPWCLVPHREGRLHEVRDFPDGYIIQDNNLLQSGRDHMLKVFAMLFQQKRGAVFSGGIQADLVDEWFADQLRGLRSINSLFLAADTAASLKPLERALTHLSFLNRRKLRVYTLIGFDGETIPQAETRLERVWELGAMPFAQLHQPADDYLTYNRDWKALSKKWMRPAAMVSSHREPQLSESSPEAWIA